tara:strand:- start:7139 stop:7459 length:321 start_codon:yes stop_codon:yes gene_type:complete
MTVFVVQEESPGQNIVSATRYGKIDYLLPRGQITFSTYPTLKRLKRKLKEFSDDDYLLLIGDPAAIGMATVVAAEYNRGKLQFLKWDRQEKQYYPIKFDIHEKGEL